jgi:hypothetical protein
LPKTHFDLMKAHQSPIATEAVECIAALYRIEKDIKGISTYPNISAFTERGQIVIGHMEPVGAVAIAAR